LQQCIYIRSIVTLSVRAYAHAWPVGGSDYYNSDAVDRLLAVAVVKLCRRLDSVGLEMNAMTVSSQLDG
jgi:hypothetical protein